MFFLFRNFLRLYFSSKKSEILVAFQNNNELRGSGGFITQLLDLTLGQAKVKFHFSHDYHELKGTVPIEPPVVIKEMLRLRQWFFRDANIFADFKISAAKMIEIYKSIYPQRQVVGVITINFSLLEELLKVLGPIKCGETIFSSDNLFFELSTSVSNIDYHNLKDLDSRKKVLKNLFHDVLKASIIRFWKWRKISKILHKSVETKDLQIFSLDKQRQQKFEAKKLFIPFTPEGFKDHLAVVENNFLGLKNNRYLRRLIFHDVHFDFDRASKKLSSALIKVNFRVEHFGSFNYPLSGTYQSALTLYIPKDAYEISYVSKNLSVEQEVENEFKTLSIRYILPVEGKFNFTFQYKLPASLFEDNTYSFKYIKQSGVHNEHVFCTIRYPDQFHLVTNEDKEVRTIESNAFINHNNLLTDFQYKLSGNMHLKPPRIFYHEIIQPKLIKISFNEPVYLTDQSKIEIFESDTKQKLKVSKIEFKNDNRHLFIHVDNLKQVNERFYSVVISDIRNMAGVMIQPNPRQITVVYRPRFFKQ